MRRRRWVTAALVSITALLASGGLLGMSAPAAVAGPAAATSRALPNPSITFPDLVSQTPVKWTPNVVHGQPVLQPAVVRPG
jgi:hypothetical protein